jgi:membrane protein
MVRPARYGFAGGAAGEIACTGGGGGAVVTSETEAGEAGSWARRLDTFQRTHRWAGLPLAVIYKFVDDQGAYQAALLTYYGFVSLFPLLLLAVTVLGFVLTGNPEAQHAVVNSALRNFPVIGDQIAGNVHSLHGNVTALVIGILVSVYGGLGVTQAAINAMNQLWVVPVAERPGLGPAYGRGALYLLVVAVGLIITTALSWLSTAVGTVLPGDAAAETLARIASALLAIAVNTGLIVVGFRLLTFRHITFRQHLPGAIVAAVAWQLLLLIGTYLVSHELQGTSASYGVFGIVLGLLAWIYLSTLVILLCAELNTVRVLRLAPRSLLSVAEPANTAVTPGDRRAFTAYAHAQRRKTFQQIDVSFHHQAPEPPPPHDPDED